QERGFFFLRYNKCGKAVLKPQMRLKLLFPRCREFETLHTLLVARKLLFHRQSHSTKQFTEIACREFQVLHDGEECLRIGDRNPFLYKSTYDSSEAVSHIVISE